MAMRRPAGILAWVSGILAMGCLVTLAARAQDDDWGEELPCDGVLADPILLVETLAEVAKYDSTYVLVFRDEHAGEVMALDSPALQKGKLSIAVYGESPAAALVTRSGLANVETYAFETALAGKLFERVLAADLDVALMWAPLAGLAALELDFDYEISMRTASTPQPMPTVFAAATAADAFSACAAEVETLLGGYGVVPADKLVQLDIRDFLLLQPPPRDLAAARQGSSLYAENCSKCHGQNLVAATDELAPVDLRISTPRFSYPGFLYIVLNGRSQNGMPGFNGTLNREQVELIYQYARERSHGLTELGSD